MLTRASAILLLLLSSVPMFGQTAGGRFVPNAIGAKKFPAPPVVARSLSAPLVTFGRAETTVPEEIDAMVRWNAAGRRPARNGFVRPIPGGIPVHAARGVWSGSVRVEGADRLRLHLTNVNVPAGTVFWISGATGQPIAFDTDLVDPSGSIYSPAVAGETAYLDVRVPDGGAASFTIREIVQLLDNPPATRTVASIHNDATVCLVDATCVDASTFPAIAQVRPGVAHLEFISNGSGFVCTGTLLNDKDTTTTIPYLLTAGHCFSDQSAASSLEAYWDYETRNCNDPPSAYPVISTLPRSNGSTLLANSSASDFTFVRLNGIPGGRWLLGWDARTSVVGDGTRLHRISHPFPDGFAVPEPQDYSNTFVNASPGATCTSWPPPNFIYETRNVGGTYGGSSGSAVMLDGGQVVGQLSGLCGADPSQNCDPSNSTVDGSFAHDYPLISQYLSPGSPTGPTQCIASTTTACVLNNRFQVQVKYRGGFDNNPADTAALVKPVSGFASSTYETAFFYFNNPNNIEMMVKLLDQGNTNSAGQPTIALLFGSATPLRIELTVIDVTNGAVKTYTSPFASQAGQTDFTAFVK